MPGQPLEYSTFCTMTKFQIDLTRARSRVDARLAKEKTELNEKNITLMLSEKATEVCLTLSAYCNDQDDTVKSEGGLGSGIGGSMTRKRQLEVDLEKEFAELDKLRGEWKKVKTEVDSGDKKEGA